MIIMPINVVFTTALLDGHIEGFRSFEREMKRSNYV